MYSQNMSEYISIYLYISTSCPPSLIFVHSTYVSILLFTICFPILEYKLHEGRNTCVSFIESPICRKVSASY